MHTTARLLLPFTGDIHPGALNDAVQIAKQHRATLVLLALIAMHAEQYVRLELLEQAQDFLILASRKASRQGVPCETMQIFTQDVVGSIEAWASQKHCEAVLLFVGRKGGVLLDKVEIQTLIKRGVCNVHLVLVPGKRVHRVGEPARTAIPLCQQQETCWLVLPDLSAPAAHNLAEKEKQIADVTLQ